MDLDDGDTDNQNHRDGTLNDEVNDEKNGLGSVDLVSARVTRLELHVAGVEVIGARCI